METITVNRGENQPKEKRFIDIHIFLTKPNPKTTLNECNY